MTVCNMSIEAGARAGLIAPDDVTFAWLADTPRAPTGAAWDAAVAAWRTLQTDEGAQFDRVVRIDARDVQPTVTWGTHPGQVRLPDVNVHVSLMATTRTPTMVNSKPIHTIFTMGSLIVIGDSNATHSGTVLTSTTELATLVY